MAVLDRLFGIVDDATAGGKDYDALSAGAIPDATVFYPVTGGNFDPGIERIDRNDEVRGRRANVGPRPFRAVPAMTVPLAVYPKAAEKLTYKLLGSNTTTGGSGSTPYSHTMKAIGYPNVALPALHAQMVRDDLNIKMAGATINRINYDFPLDGEGTMEIEMWGKFFNEFATASPAPSYTDFGATVDTLMLRDAVMVIDGESTPVQDLQGFSLSFSNELIRKFYAGRNVVPRTIGSPTSYKKLWFPAENKAQAAPEITFSMTFGNTRDAQETYLWYAVAQRLEVTIAGNFLAGPYGVNKETMKFFLYCAQETGGGASDLSARDDTTSTYDGGVFFSESDVKDLEIIFTSSTPTIT